MQNSRAGDWMQRQQLAVLHKLIFSAGNGWSAMLLKAYQAAVIFGLKCVQIISALNPKNYPGLLRRDRGLLWDAGSWLGSAKIIYLWFDVFEQIKQKARLGALFLIDLLTS